MTNFIALQLVREAPLSPSLKMPPLRRIMMEINQIHLLNVGAMIVIRERGREIVKPRPRHLRRAWEHVMLTSPTRNK